MNGQYEVLSPWAEVDQMSLKGISPRVNDLIGKKIGLLDNSKTAASSILTVIEEKLQERYPTCEISRYVHHAGSFPEMDTEYKAKFTDWIKGVDAVIGAVGD